MDIFKIFRFKNFIREVHCDMVGDGYLIMRRNFLYEEVWKTQILKSTHTLNLGGYEENFEVSSLEKVDSVLAKMKIQKDQSDKVNLMDLIDPFGAKDESDYKLTTILPYIFKEYKFAENFEIIRDYEGHNIKEDFPEHFI